MTISSSAIPVPLLREGTKESKDREAFRSNLSAAKLIAEIVRSALGPRAMDKMLVDSLGYVTITNDGVTILKEIDIEHPAGKMMVEIAKTTDNAVGDGTKSAVLLAGTLIEMAEELIKMGIHPTIVVDGFRKASVRSIEILNNVAEKISVDDKNVLIRIANTSIQSKLVSEYSTYLSELVVDATLRVAEKMGENFRIDIDSVKVQKSEGGSISDTKLIRGIVLDNEVVHVLMPKRVEDAMIALLNVPLQLDRRSDRRIEFKAKINIETPDKMKMFLDEENRMLKAIVEKVVQAGANVVICQKGIDDMIQYYLAKAGILAVKRVKDPEMIKLSKATGGSILTDIRDLTGRDLGRAGLVEERKVGNKKWFFVEEYKNTKSLTVMVRGGSQGVIEEVERSIHDALMVLKDVIEKPAIVAGGGAAEACVARKLREWAKKISGREQLVVQKFAQALIIIPLTLAVNAGMDPIDTLTGLKAKQKPGCKWIGIDVRGRKIADMMKKGIIEPFLVKEQIIKSATEVTCMLLRIDDIIAKPKQKEQPRKLKGIDIDTRVSK